MRTKNSDKYIWLIPKSHGYKITLEKTFFQIDSVDISVYLRNRTYEQFTNKSCGNNSTNYQIIQKLSGDTSKVLLPENT